MTASPRDKEKIKGWRELAKSYNEDQFIQFALEYFAFNALIKTYFFQNKPYVQDRTLIEKLKKDINCSKDILNEKSVWISKLKEELDKEPLKNNTKKHPEIKIENETDWRNIVEAVYVIRNNLFHGEKWSDEPRDQNLVEIGYQILSGFNEYLINKV